MQIGKQSSKLISYYKLEWYTYLTKTTILSYSISDEIVNTEKNTNLFVGKTFQSWDHVANFMKRYGSVKGYGIRIDGGGKVDIKILKSWCDIFNWYLVSQDNSKVHLNCVFVVFFFQFDKLFFSFFAFR